MLTELINENEKLQSRVLELEQQQIRGSQAVRQSEQLKRELMYYATGEGEKPNHIELENAKQRITELEEENKELRTYVDTNIKAAG